MCVSVIRLILTVDDVLFTELFFLGFLSIPAVLILAQIYVNRGAMIFQEWARDLFY